MTLRAVRRPAHAWEFFGFGDRQREGFTGDSDFRRPHEDVRVRTAENSAIDRKRMIVTVNMPMNGSCLSRLQA